MNNRLQTNILLSQFIMLLALEMTNPFLPLLIARQANMTMASTVLYSTLALALPMLANIIMGPVWGMAADKWGYKPMLMRAAWVLVLTQALMIFAESATWILIVRLIQGAFAGFIVAMQTYALSQCEWQHKSRQLARLQSAKAIATTLAGITGGLFLTLFGYRGLYTVAMLLCLLTTLFMQHTLPSVRRTTTHPTATPPSLARPMSLGGSVFLILCLMITMTQIAKFLTDPVFTLALNKLFHANVLWVGLLYSLPAVGMLCSAEWSGRQFDRCRTNPAMVKQYLISYSLLGTLIMLGHAFATNLFLLSVVRIGWGVIMAAILPALFALISDHHQRQGYAIGIANSFAKLGNLAGLLLGGWLAGFIPFLQLFLVVAAIYALIAIISYGPLTVFGKSRWSWQSMRAEL
ncbi:MFS transporter [Legionella spiritensis]|uniref:Multidrug resistance efflux pump n=1 Tax=Legionella spiritensis TaxID=452 RepID=A0A0W0Z6I2_LEGSP|nr:MFS transporter [Legionella spiritensis]KTD64741.1 multidrug resistance efflux pump [Legionella spiritensis]SNV48145.1 multidrug resistance efflux pump [Legionella spiritensis]VEG91421.1 multidrug resistance efflux pump [Legionella spiritensis]